MANLFSKYVSETLNKPRADLVVIICSMIRLQDEVLYFLELDDSKT